jgi:hypothetical protein
MSSKTERRKAKRRVAERKDRVAAQARKAKATAKELEHAAAKKEREEWNKLVSNSAWGTADKAAKKGDVEAWLSELKNLRRVGVFGEHWIDPPPLWVEGFCRKVIDLVTIFDGSLTACHWKTDGFEIEVDVQGMTIFIEGDMDPC